MGSSPSSTSTTSDGPQKTKAQQAFNGQYLKDPNNPDAGFKDFNTDISGSMGAANQRTAGLDQHTLDAIGMTDSNVGRFGGNFTAANNFANAAGNTQLDRYGSVEGFSKGADGSWNPNDRSSMIQSNMNPFTQNVINSSLANINQQGQQRQMGIDDAATSAGAFGGSRNGVQAALGDQLTARESDSTIAGLNQANYAQASATTDGQMARGMSQIGANTSAGVQQAGLQANAGNQLGQLAGAGQSYYGQDANAVANAGGILSGQNQKVLDAASGLNQQTQGWGAALASGMAGLSNASSTTTTSNSGSNIWGTLLGAGASMLMPSDETAKTNIKDADTNASLDLIRKLSPKTYEYTADAKAATGAPPGSRTGFMAQDLEKATGQAAPQVGGGYKGVDLAQHAGHTTAAISALADKMDKIEKRLSGKKKAA